MKKSFEKLLITTKRRFWNLKKFFSFIHCANNIEIASFFPPDLQIAQIASSKNYRKFKI